MKNFFDKFNNLNGAKFIGIKRYENSYGEVADLSVLVNVSVENMKKNDLEKLKAITVADLNKLAEEKNLNAETMHKALSELIASGEKNLSKKKEDRTVASQAQTDAYLQLTKGVRMHKETMQVYVFGMVQSKKIIIEGDYPATNKREKTICKDTIKKHFDLRSDKVRQYKVGEFDQLKVDGTTFVKA